MINKGEYKEVTHDRILDAFVNEIDLRARESGLKHTAVLRRLEKKSGISYATLASWYHHRTKRPQFVTVEFALKHLDIELCLRHKSTGQIYRIVRNAA